MCTDYIDFMRAVPANVNSDDGNNVKQAELLVDCKYWFQSTVSVGVVILQLPRAYLWCYQ